MLHEYNGYLIQGHAAMIHPYDPRHYPAGTILKHGRAGSLIEVGRVELPSFTMEVPELAEWFGLELCKIAVDEAWVAGKVAIPLCPTKTMVRGHRLFSTRQADLNCPHRHLN